MLVTLPAGGLGDAAPWIWLVAARAGALMALAGAAVLVARVAGPLAGAAAALLVAVSPWWLFNGALGNSEPLLVALIAWAAVAHDSGRERGAFLLGFGAALLRPEVWPFLLAYALWLGRGRVLSWAALALAGCVLVGLWTLPDLAGSGWSFDAAFGENARDVEGAAAQAGVPFLAVWGDFLELATAPVVLAALIAAWRLPPARAWAAAALAWVFLVALMAQLDLPNHPRYLIPALAAFAAAAGSVLGTVDEQAPRALDRRRLGRRGGYGRHKVAIGWFSVVAALALVGGTLAFTLDDLDRQREDLDRRERVAEALDDAVARAGGAGRLRACGAVRTGPDQRAAVARVVGVPISEALARPRPGDVTVTLGAGERWTIRGCPGD